MSHLTLFSEPWSSCYSQTSYFISLQINLFIYKISPPSIVVKNKENDTNINNILLVAYVDIDIVKDEFCGSNDKLISGLFLKMNEHREHKMNKQRKGSQYMSKPIQAGPPHIDPRVVYYKTPGGSIHVNNKVNASPRNMQCTFSTAEHAGPESTLQCYILPSLDPVGRRE